MKTHLLLVGLSHHTAPVELREQVDFARRGLADALATLVSRADIGEGVVLSTCNRAEVYTTCADPNTAQQSLRLFVSEFHGVEQAHLEPHLYALTNDAVAQHLFRVAAGMDSLVVGEPQILGQVKDAYTIAAERHCTGGLLNKLFHSAFAVGKRVRSETGLAEGAVSVSFAAVSLARKIFGRLNDLTVLVLGTGEMGAQTARHLQSQHVKQILIASRTEAHAATLAEEIGGTVVPWSRITHALGVADILITATGSPAPIVTRRHVQESMHAGRTRPLFLIDIAVPRDIDPGAGDLEQVFLYNIDDLRGIVQENLARRTAEIDQAEAIVREEVQKFNGWLRSRDAIPTVVALRERFESIRRAELKRLEPKIAALSPEARARIDEITRLIIEKLLLTPTEQLKAASDEQTVLAYSDALSRLFSLSAADTLLDEPRASLSPDDDRATPDPVRS